MSEAPYVLRQDSPQGVTSLILNRPNSRNSLSLAMLQALGQQMRDCAKDHTVRVVILKGDGPAFCAGHDLKEVNAGCNDQEQMKRLFDTCCQVMQLIIALPKPVIAQVHGVATAAGCQLVATCDLAVAAHDARFATPGVNIGLFCSTPMVALSRNVGHKAAMQMLLTGELIDADTALRMGLISQISPAADLDSSTMALASKLAKKSAMTLAIGKEAFYKQAEMSLADAYAYASTVMQGNMTIADAQEGIKAFLDKRPPVWSKGGVSVIAPDEA